MRNKPPTLKAFDNVYKQPHSENEKPYYFDEYPDLQYFLNPPFGFPMDWYNYDGPVRSPIDADPGPPPWILTFHCQISGCWCPNEETCLPLVCNQQVTGAVLSNSWQSSDFVISVSAGQICITASATAEGSVEVDIQMIAKAGQSIVTGEHGSIQILECAETDCECREEFAIAWDYDNSPETISRSTSETVYVLAGTAPYDWSVSGGSGFTLDDAQTAGLTNTLNADASACGTAEITVVDACGYDVTGYVRCPDSGNWNAKAYECKCPGTKTSQVGVWVYKVCDAWRNGNRYGVCGAGFSDWAGCPTGFECETCNSWCANRGSCQSYGCSECVEFLCSDYGAYDHQCDWHCANSQCVNEYYLLNYCFGAWDRVLQKWECP